MANKKKTLPCLTFTQNGSTMLVTTMTANELIAYTHVDPYNPDLDFDDEKQGYQRPPSTARIKKLGNFLDFGVKKDAVKPMPTAILLSDRGVKSTINENSFSFNAGDSFGIVDGQHRIEGIKHAIEVKGNETLGEFSYAVVIMTGMNRLTEMDQFKIVNGEAKSVNTSLVSMLLTQVYKRDGVVEDKDIWRVIASDTLDKLNKDENSMWYDMILMPAQSRYTRHEIKENKELEHRRLCTAQSFLQSLRPIIKYGDESLWRQHGPEYAIQNLVEILNAFWKAIGIVMKPAFKKRSEYVVQRSVGVFSLHILLRNMMENIFNSAGDVTNYDSYLKVIDGAHYKTLFSDFWIKEQGDALEVRANQFGSMKGFNELAQKIQKDLLENRPPIS